MEENQNNLYRKYRPQKFSDVIGQEQVVSALEGSIQNGNISQAYLLHGTRGIGKTTLARIFAKELETAPEDLYEIDAASYTGVDNIRELNASVKALPYNSKYKIYIIDEVHMLSKSAFNALLKTIEEPPAHVIFILATTEIAKVIDTVVSRCQVFTLKTPTSKTLRTLIEKVAKAENIKIKTESINIIAMLGDGSFRDTLGVLQKIMSTSKGKELSPKEVQKITGASSESLVREAIKSLGSADTNTSLTILNKAKKEGIDAYTFLLQIMFYLRSLLLIRFAPDMHAELKKELGEGSFEFLMSLRGKEGMHANASLLTKAIDAIHLVRRSHMPYLPIELMAISQGEPIHNS